MTLNARIWTVTTASLPSLLLGICLLFTAAASAVAETRYVSDELQITLRTGQSTQHQILSMIASGTPLEVLETNADSGYSRVRTPQGVEGWVLTRYLMDHPSAQDQLANAKKKLARLEEEKRNLQSKLSAVSGDKSSLDKDKAELLAKNDELEKELDHIRKTAANALAIESEKNRLADETNKLQTELQTVQQENRSLKDRSNREWFVRGAAVVVVGILLGLILPRIRFRSRSRWKSF
ncbi:MAG: TIGR04211 family SH3 domain-containing protein [Gammaproteobacteria bacterium]|jgi:SH3 domain protein